MKNSAVCPDVETFDIKHSGGPIAARGDAVTLLYKLALTRPELERGDWIESTYEPEEAMDVILDVEHLLPGVLATVVGMRAGGSMRIARIPPELAYGDRGCPGVPPNSDVWIEVCLGVVRKPA